MVTLQKARVYEDSQFASSGQSPDNRLTSWETSRTGQSGEINFLKLQYAKTVPFSFLYCSIFFFSQRKRGNHPANRIKQKSEIRTLSLICTYL